MAARCSAPLPGGRLGRQTPLRAEHLADRAVHALIAEAMLTPKPALVDQRGSGAHEDLNLDCLLRSAAALRGSFTCMALHASAGPAGLPLRDKLGAIGRQGEERMLAATGGRNAHRGAIWVLGLLIAAVAAALARLPDRHAPVRPSHGLRVCARFGVSGARGEAAAGFPHVMKVGLPALHSTRRRGSDE